MVLQAPPPYLNSFIPYTYFHNSFSHVTAVFSSYFHGNAMHPKAPAMTWENGILVIDSDHPFVYRKEDLVIVFLQI